MEKAEAWRRRRRAGARPALTKDTDAGQEHLRRRGRSCWACRCSTTVKSLVLATDELNDAGEIVKVQVWLLLLRGDHDMNEIKVGKVPGLDAASALRPCRNEEHFGTKPGYLGPIGLKKPVKMVADREVAVMADWICGANEEDFPHHRRQLGP
jgi:prolyl-tRNA synthetase